MFGKSGKSSMGRQLVTTAASRVRIAVSTLLVLLGCGHETLGEQGVASPPDTARDAAFESTATATASDGGGNDVDAADASIDDVNTAVDESMLLEAAPAEAASSDAEPSFDSSDALEATDA